MLRLGTRPIDRDILGTLRRLGITMMVEKVILIYLVTCFAVTGIGATAPEFEHDDDSEDSPLSQTCLKCICKVMGCVKDEGCVDGVCGVMHMTLGYWTRAHYKTDDPEANIEEFEKCSNNVWCSVRTVQRYMKQFLPPCEDKRPDRLKCENALALHKFGSVRCDRNLTESTERKLLSCLDETVWGWLGEEEEK